MGANSWPRISPQYYTQIYDAVVGAVQEINPDQKFIGLSLAHGVANGDYLKYFLNSANHKPGIPLDMIAYHHYSFPQYNDTDMWGTILKSTQQFLDGVVELEKIRLELSPHTLLNIEEFGIIVGTGKEFHPPPLPKEYWNFAATQYGYAFAWLSNLGNVHALGMSQFVGYPGNFPSLPMIDWQDGQVNARYWALRMIIDHLGPSGGQRKIHIVKTTSSNAGEVYSAGFITHHTSQHPQRKLLLTNLTPSTVTVYVAGVSGGELFYVDVRTGAKGKPAHERIQGDRVSLGGYAVAVVVLPEN
jgi:hypothetical protein